MLEHRILVVKEGAFTYRVEQFNNRGERKLREVLKKLPGVEVDRVGDVTLNGRKVTKLMVDQRYFLQETPSWGPRWILPLLVYHYPNFSFY